MYGRRRPRGRFRARALDVSASRPRRLARIAPAVKPHASWSRPRGRNCARPLDRRVKAVAALAAVFRSVAVALCGRRGPRRFCKPSVFFFDNFAEVWCASPEFRGTRLGSARRRAEKPCRGVPVLNPRAGKFPKSGRACVLHPRRQLKALPTHHHTPSRPCLRVRRQVPLKQEMGNFPRIRNGVEFRE